MNSNRHAQFLVAAFLAPLWGCVAATAPADPGASPIHDDVRFIGDPAGVVELAVVAGDAMLVPIVLGDGDDLPLLPPPQGGFVSFVGVRAQNLDGHDLRLTAALRDVASGIVFGLESRTVELFDDRGWGAPPPMDPSSLANVALCPDFHDVDVQGHAFALEVSLRDRSGRTGTARIGVVPRCALADAAAQRRCLCACSANATLGGCASP